MAILALVALAAASAAEVDTVVDPRGGASSPAAETDASAELGEAAAAPREWRPKLSFSIASFRSLLAKKQKKCNPKRDTSCCRAPRRAPATLPAPARPRDAFPAEAASLLPQATGSPSRASARSG